MPSIQVGRKKPIRPLLTEPECADPAEIVNGKKVVFFVELSITQTVGPDVPPYNVSSPRICGTLSERSGQARTSVSNNHEKHGVRSERHRRAIPRAFRFSSQAYLY